MSTHPEKSWRNMPTQELLFIRNPNFTNKSKPLVHGLTQYLLKTGLVDSPESSPPEAVPKDDLFRCMRIFLRFGRIFGIAPISGIFGNDLYSIYFRSRSVAGFVSLFVILHLSIYNAIALLAFFRQKKNDASEIVTNLREFMFAGIGLYVYCFMHQNSKKLIHCLHTWRSVKTAFYKEDTHLFRSITLISGIIYFFGIIENFGSHWKVVRDTYFAVNRTSKHDTVLAEDTGKNTITENYFLEEYPQFVGLVPYNLATAIFFYVGDKCAVLAWNFGDILIALIGRAIHKRFQLHCEDLKCRLDIDPSLTYDSHFWNQAVADHENLLGLLDQFKSLLSPLIFACCFTNIYFICINFFFFLSPSEDGTVNNVYNALAFLQLLVRTFTAIFYSAKVNDCAHEIGQYLSTCSASIMTKEMERAEFKLKTTTIGFDGLNCFTITKPFILSTFNVIFTLEIVLLQTSAGTASANAAHHVPS